MDDKQLKQEATALRERKEVIEKEIQELRVSYGSLEDERDYIVQKLQIIDSYLKLQKMIEDGFPIKTNKLKTAHTILRRL